jgi:(p)ppGpp synthase/HD superfamily hydrolase
MDHKSFIAMRFWLLGKEMHTALSAMEFAAKFHTGFRKDGVTPEFYHQISIANYLRTFVNTISYPEETLVAAFLHDVCEDYDVGFDEISSKFGLTISTAVVFLTKQYRGVKIPPEAYYRQISNNAIASLVKGGDRINNIQTMVGVFDLKKQQEYIEETEKLVLPMLKSARRQFTKQENIYINSKFMLESQITLIRAIHNAKV